MTEIKIGSYDEWCDFARKCAYDEWSKDKYVVLTDTIDCSMKKIVPVPYFAGIFDGNGYSKEWLEEAARRGLPNKESYVDAIECLTYTDTINMFERQGVLSKAELEARAEISYELYSKTINIEARTMIEMASRKFIPAAVKHAKLIADTINAVTAALDETEADNTREMLP